ncbi:ATP dependent DNA ligase [Methanococcus maripaludis C5]|uniref:ATP dependent DNA ligase n=1 Tax=Methanococcus maripaludis (strain C5 / ATCC BAA-1333) TaxID=402880 RepID=A4FZC6_METM5|nr:RNA ligase [Methanococcus maripaludis]ABO35560.1 ATP dependent DNA ligase [Methanococcus maripaludis C5]
MDKMYLSEDIPNFEEFIINASKRLNIDEDTLENGFKRKLITKYEYNGKKYLCFKKKLKHIERGTILFLNDNLDFIQGYPKIRRAMVLESAVEKYFDNKIAVEEKLDGYNIRIVKFYGEIIAITRGGKICPFTTKKVKKYMNTKFLDDFPELMLCGEMVGLNNPYVSHYYPEADKNHENLGFYIFDIRNKETNSAISISEKEKLLDKYDIPYVKPIKIIDSSDFEELWNLLDDLNEKHREGVVLKDLKMIKNPIKYTTHNTQCGDLSVAFKYVYDLGIDFMFSRLVREGYQSFEKCENEEEIKKRSHDLGESILTPMVETIKEISKDGLAKECFELYFDSEDDFNEFINYLKTMHINFAIETREYIKKDVFKAKICRIYNSTSNKIKSHLEGNLW